MLHGTTSPRVAKKREERVEALLDAAFGILASDGLEGLTLAKVAQAMGWVPAALYRYVESKDGLVARMQRRAVADLQAGFRASQEELRRAEGRTAPATVSLARLLRGARFYLELPTSRPQSWFLLAVLLGDPRPLLSDEESRRTAPLLLALLGDVRELFEQAAATGALSSGDATVRTLAFWAALQGALSLEKARRIAPVLPTSAEVGLASARALLTGWGAAAEALGRAEKLSAHTDDRSPNGGDSSERSKR